jgi:hypothetical protein
MQEREIPKQGKDIPKIEIQSRHKKVGINPEPFHLPISVLPPSESIKSLLSDYERICSGLGEKPEIYAHLIIKDLEKYNPSIRMSLLEGEQGQYHYYRYIEGFGGSSEIDEKKVKKRVKELQRLSRRGIIEVIGFHLGLPADESAS